MKNQIKKLLLITMLFASIAGSANERSYSLESKEATVAKLVLENVKKGGKLSILDADNVLLYKEPIEVSGTYSQNFDFSNLPIGKYYFEIDMGSKYQKVPFEVHVSSVVIKYEEKYEIFKPVVYTRDNHVYLSKFSMVPCKLSILIYDSNDEKIHMEDFKENSTINRVLDFSKIRKGKYKLVISSENRTYIETVSI